MSKDWDPGSFDPGYIGKSSHSNAPDPYDWPLAGQPHAAYRVPSSACEQRWTLGMVVVVEGVVVHLRLAVADGPAPTAVLALACNTFL